MTEVFTHIHINDPLTADLVRLFNRILSDPRFNRVGFYVFTDDLAKALGIDEGTCASVLTNMGFTPVCDLEWERGDGEESLIEALGLYKTKGAFRTLIAGHQSTSPLPKAA